MMDCGELMAQQSPLVVIRTKQNIHPVQEPDFIADLNGILVIPEGGHDAGRDTVFKSTLSED